MKAFRTGGFFLSSLIVCIFSDLADDVDGFEPVTVGVASATAIGISAIAANFNAIKSQFFESCDENWIKKDTASLGNSLRSRLHGQHLVVDNIVRSLRSHIYKEHQNRKALAMSFHGWTGCGKNYVSQIIAEHLFREGMSSKFVHFFTAINHFPHTSQTALYKDQLMEWISGNVTKCARSIFIFDEVDKMPPGLLDIVLPFLDYHESVNGVDYRRSIFIFLSNTAGSDINRKTYEIWSAGKPREEITYKQMEEVIMQAAFSDQNSGLWNSALIEKNLINLFVPFLPLEAKHVKLCIRDDLMRKNISVSDEIIDKVMNELHFMPPESKLYSKSGCKRVFDKVDLIVEEM